MSGIIILHYSMDPKIWGPHAWFFIDTICISYPNNNPDLIKKDIYRNFFNILGDILPCKSCQIHYKNHMNRYPLTDEILSSRNSLLLWILQIHNVVNKSIGKKEISLDKFIKYYNDKYTGNSIIGHSKYNKSNKTNKFNKANKSHYYIITSVLSIIVLVGVMYVYFKKE